MCVTQGNLGNRKVHVAVQLESGGGGSYSWTKWMESVDSVVREIIQINVAPVIVAGVVCVCVLRSHCLLSLNWFYWSGCYLLLQDSSCPGCGGHPGGLAGCHHHLFGFGWVFDGCLWCHFNLDHWRHFIIYEFFGLAISFSLFDRCCIGCFPHGKVWFSWASDLPGFTGQSYWKSWLKQEAVSGIIVGH